MRASLRDLRSPRKNYKSTIEDDLKKLIIMDNLAPEQERDAGVRTLPAACVLAHRIGRGQVVMGGQGRRTALPVAS